MTHLALGLGTSLLLLSCSAYESDGRKNFERDFSGAETQRPMELSPSLSQKLLEFRAQGNCQLLSATEFVAFLSSPLTGETVFLTRKIPGDLPTGDDPTTSATVEVCNDL